MHRLQPPDPQWINFADAGIPGVRVLFAPVSPLAHRDGRRVARVALAALPPEAGDADRNEAMGYAYSREVIAASVRDWEGIGDAEGAALAFSPEAAQQFVGDPKLFEAADVLFVTPYLLKDAEKNASAPSPNGTSRRAAAKPTAKGASRRGAAKPALMKSTRRGPTRAK